MRLLLIPLSLALALAAGPVRAGEVTIFAASPQPADNWTRGYGATLTSTWFSVLAFEGEACRQAADVPEGSMTSFTGSALLAPSLGFVTPFGGVGIGLFRQQLGSASDTGVLRTVVAGVKAKVGPLLVVRAEYRRIELPVDTLIRLDHRFALGAGISF